VVFALVVAAAIAIPLSQVDHLEDEQVETNNSTGPLVPQQNGTQAEELKDAKLGEQVNEGNAAADHYPVDPSSKYMYAESSETIAAVPTMDPENKTVHGIYDEPTTFDRPEIKHPMEIATPLEGGTYPCDPNVHVNVSVPAAVMQPGFAFPMLPLHYGCSVPGEMSREKASPEISWTNVLEDVTEFSMQLVSMGTDHCDNIGEDAGKILWHVVGINETAPLITFQEGASHDTRMLHGGTEEPNQWLEEYYSGPCPPPGDTQCYRFKVLAHRSNGWCQCGHQDVLFSRPAPPPTPWVYKEPELAGVGAVAAQQ